MTSKVRSGEKPAAKSGTTESSSVPEDSKKRTKKPAYDLKHATVSQAADQTMNVLRRSALDTDPIGVGVRDASDDVVYEVGVKPGEEQQAINTLRRAGHRFNRGVKATIVGEGKIKFVTGPKRAQRKKGEKVVAPEAQPEG